MTASFPCFLLFTAVIKEDPPVTAHLMKETVDEPEGVTCELNGFISRDSSCEAENIMNSHDGSITFLSSSYPWTRHVL